jgi:hypothetical protein
VNRGQVLRLAARRSPVLMTLGVTAGALVGSFGYLL